MGGLVQTRAAEHCSNLRCNGHPRSHPGAREEPSLRSLVAHGSEMAGEPLEKERAHWYCPLSVRLGGPATRKAGRRPLRPYEKHSPRHVYVSALEVEDFLMAQPGLRCNLQDDVKGLCGVPEQAIELRVI
jgi:hypothetical protein